MKVRIEKDYSIACGLGYYVMLESWQGYWKCVACTFTLWGARRVVKRLEMKALIVEEYDVNV